MKRGVRHGKREQKEGAGAYKVAAEAASAAQESSSKGRSQLCGLSCGGYSETYHF